MAIAKRSPKGKSTGTAKAGKPASKPSPEKGTDVHTAEAIQIVQVEGHFGSEQKVIDVRKFVTAHAQVGATSSLQVPTPDGGKAFISVTVSLPCYIEEIEAAIEAAEDRVDTWLTERAEALPTVEEALEGEEADDNGADEGEAEEGGDPTEEDVMKMKKAELLALAEEYEIELDEDAKLGAMRKQLVEELFDGEDADEDADGEDADEDADEGELTEADVKKMKKPELLELAEEYELEVDEDAKLADLKAEIIEALFEGEDEADADEADEDEGDEDEGEGEEDDADPYTEEELEDMKLKDLSEIAEHWELSPKVPKDTPLAKKKAIYIKAILKAQE